jgi:PadR family transcriptional regulator, regulatory protein PadR
MVVPATGPESLLAQLRRGTLEYCVLALLQEEELYGFELIRRLELAEGLVTSEGTIYPLLARLRRTGWVATRWQESPSGPPRKYYSVTTAGRGALKYFKAEWENFSRAVNEILEGRAP